MSEVFTAANTKSLQFMGLEAVDWLGGGCGVVGDGKV